MGDLLCSCLQNNILILNFNMLPPKYAKSVKITAHEKPVKVTATYDGVKEGQEDTKVEKNLADGESHTFEEKSESMGSWTAFRKIKHLRVEGDDGEHEHNVEEDCQGVHAIIHYQIQPEKKLLLIERN